MAFSGKAVRGDSICMSVAVIVPATGCGSVVTTWTYAPLASPEPIAGVYETATTVPTPPGSASSRKLEGDRFETNPLISNIVTGHIIIVEQGTMSMYDA